MTDELLEQFLIEGRELAAAAVVELAALAGDPADTGRLDALFRHLHTLKGSAALFDLPALTAMLHAGETILDRARGARRLEAAAASEVAGVIDLTETWLDALETSEAPDIALIERTRAAEKVLSKGRVAEGPAVATPTEDGPGRAWAADLVGNHPGAAVAVRYRPAFDAFFRGEDPLATIRALPGLAALKLSTPVVGAGRYDPFRCTLEIVALSTASMDDVRGSLRLVADEVEIAAVESAAEPVNREVSSGPLIRSLRVDARQIDALAAMIDELVVAKNSLARPGSNESGHEGHGRAAAGAALDRVVSDLHAAITELRLTPLGPLFARFPRQVREMALELGKEVDFEVSGEGVAVDKTVVEGLFGPLLHLIRNAVDHGVEAPEPRRAAGKPGAASVRLSARAHGDEVVVEVADDGRGVDVGRIREVATRRGLLSADAAARLSDEDAAMLIFAPGFSTAASVSSISGRGVGMDAVRTAVAEMGGRVRLDNRPGQGVTVGISLPARVVLTKVLVIEAGGERFGAPLDAVAETHRVRAEEIAPVRAGRAFVRRGQVIPLLRLSRLLGLPERNPTGAIPVLTIDAGGERVGVEIDAIVERIEAPLRPMSGPLSGYPGVLGAVLQSDGDVLLVLDLPELTHQGAAA